VTDFNFKNFKEDMLLTTCILSGCDYLESIKGIGFKKAFKLIHEYGDDLPAILKKIRREGKLIIPLDYEQNFQLALLTFKFQMVYCPEKRELVHLNDPETHPLGSLLVNYPDLSFLGEQIDKNIAVQICTGEIDPVTREKFQVKTQPKTRDILRKAPAKKSQKGLSKQSKNLHNFF
jgi:exonuclease-1